MIWFIVGAFAGSAVTIGAIAICMAISDDDDYEPKH